MNYDYVLGIDLGTTNTLACYFVGGKKRLLKFPPGETMLPSVVFTDDDGKVTVGQMAQNQGVVQPDNMISSSKTFIGNLELNKTWNCGGKIYTPTDVATEILREVRRQFIKRVKLDDNAEIGAVITVPAYFNDNQRDETRKAGEAAGFHVMWILEEPTAAAIEAVHEKQLDKKVFVVDIGGGTFDLSVLEADHENHTYRAVAIDGDDRLGGDNFDKIIQRKLISKIEDDVKINLDDAESAMLDETEYNKLMHRLLTEARKIKEGLSETQQYEVNLPNFARFDGKDYSLDFTMTRAEFDEICKPLYERIFTKLNHFVKENNNFWLDEIGHVIMAGGSCYIPYIRERIYRDVGIRPDSDLDMSRLVVIGAARVAEAKNSGIAGGGIELQSVLAHSLGVEIMTSDGRLIFDRILAKDTPYPCAATREYETAFDNQTRIDVNVYEAGVEGALELKFHRYRGTLSLKNLPAAPKGETFVDVKFEYTEDQRLKVTATDLQRENHFEEQILDKTARGES